MNIIDWMIEHKYAKNNWQAWHIAEGLKLIELRDNPPAQQERVRLYRAWRDSQIFPASDTASCYAKAIAGERVPELFEAQATAVMARPAPKVIYVEVVESASTSRPGCAVCGFDRLDGERD